jgi:Ca-activated chloride channel family protein
LSLRRLLALGAALVAFGLAVTAAGCGGSANTLTVLAGSEVKDLEPLLGDIASHTGIHLQLDYTGTIAGTQAIVDGQDHHDLAWFSHSKYLDLLQQSGTKRVHGETPIMLSPVVLGVRRSVAQRLGWASRKDVTWRDVAEAAKAGKLQFAMTNPAVSNSGFTALVGVAAAFAGSADALNSGKLDTKGLKELFKGQKLTAGSSGWLADAFVAAQDRLDGIVNYESVLLSLNASGRLHEPLDLIYPTEGIITANYPLLLLNDSKRAQYDKLTTYLLSRGFQQKLMQTTLRRPVTPGVPLDKRLPHALLVELPFPSSVKTIDAILFAYLNDARPPAHATFVLDVSGSMGDQHKLDHLKEALRGLAGLDTTLTGRFSTFHRREQLTFIPFSGQIGKPADFSLEGSVSTAAGLAQIRGFVDQLKAGGETAIYSALIAAYRRATDEQAREPGRYYSIVLMTDGENTTGQSVQDFLNFYNALPAPAKQIRTFAVLFGDASPAELNQIANTTGGKVFDARRASLSDIFKEIRGYQ